MLNRVWKSVDLNSMDHDLIDKIIEELHGWNDRHRAQPNRVVVHDRTLELMQRQRMNTQPPLLRQNEDGDWTVIGVPVYTSDQVELGAILIE